MTGRRSLLAGAWLLLFAYPAEAQFSGSCRIESLTSIAVGRQAEVGADLVADPASGSVLVRRGAATESCVDLSAAAVRVLGATSIHTVRSPAADLATGVQRRGGLLEQPMNLSQSACEASVIACGTQAVFVRSGAVRTLAPGVYGNLRVGVGARLDLAAGDYTFCRVRVARQAAVVGTTATVVDVAGRVRVGPGGSVGPGQAMASSVADSSAHRLRVRSSGARVLLGRDSVVDADWSAPSAALRLGRRATMTGSACAGDVVLGARSRSRCPQGLRPRLCFTDVTEEAGAGYDHEATVDLSQPFFEDIWIHGGVGAGDYDGDGDIDLYGVRGEAGPNVLLRNNGDGTFTDTAASMGVALEGEYGSGPVFADWDGDGDEDLWIGGVEETPVRMFRNEAGAAFTEVTDMTMVAVPLFAMGAAFGDLDLDGDLDLCVGEWTLYSQLGSEPCFTNDGDGSFTAASDALGVLVDNGALLNLFSPNFADVDDDGWPDLLATGDFGDTHLFRNLGGTFELDQAHEAILDVENGMGAAIEDYDNDGDLDWFISSIWDPDGVAERNWGITGNRLYRNDGNGNFLDVTEEAGVRHGYWGWGSCMVDFDLDGWPDIFHVNGYGQDLTEEGGSPLYDIAPEFREDPSVFFRSNRDGTFTEQAVELGILDHRQGRGVVCFDYDGDGDLDIFIANNRGRSRLYRNDRTDGHWLAVALDGAAPNTRGIGSRVRIWIGMNEQMRELRAGTNFESQDPPIAWFGLGEAASVDEVRISWLYGGETVLEDISADQLLRITEPTP